MTPTLFLGRHIDSGKWAEWQLQSYIIQEARRAGYFIEGDQNQGKRSYGAAARAKACGMQAGTPDMRVLVPGGKTVWIELKLKKGRLSPAQRDWHYIAMLRGHKVHVIYADTPHMAFFEFQNIMAAHA